MMHHFQGCYSQNQNNNSLHKKVIGKGVLDLGKSECTDGIRVGGGSIREHADTFSPFRFLAQPARSCSFSNKAQQEGKIQD